MSSSDSNFKLVSAAISSISDNREVQISLEGNDDPLRIKEGIEYNIKLKFKISLRIIPGLRYHHQVVRKGINVDKESIMIGSYGPKDEEQEFISPELSMPKGMIARGNYDVASKIIDDDANVQISWNWGFDICRDWN